MYKLRALMRLNLYSRSPSNQKMNLVLLLLVSDLVRIVRTRADGCGIEAPVDYQQVYSIFIYVVLYNVCLCKDAGKIMFH